MTVDEVILRALVTYRSVRPDRVAKGISEKGGGLSGAAKREKNMARERNASV
jgi:hypothetical protein